MKGERDPLGILADLQGWQFQYVSQGTKAFLPQFTGMCFDSYRWPKVYGENWPAVEQSMMLITLSGQEYKDSVLKLPMDFEFLADWIEANVCFKTVLEIQS